MSFVPTADRLAPELSDRERIVLLARALWHEGYDDHLAGHITVNQGDGTLLCNPWLLTWEEFGPDDVIRIDLDGNVLEGNWPAPPRHPTAPRAAQGAPGDRVGAAPPLPLGHGLVRHEAGAADPRPDRGRWRRSARARRRVRRQRRRRQRGGEGGGEDGRRRSRAARTPRRLRARHQRQRGLLARR